MPSSDFYPVVGRKDTGRVFDRLPIETLQKDKPEQFTLFILAYLLIQDRGASIQALSVSAGPLPIPPGSGALPASFLKIAGIHGKPYEFWTGDKEKFPSDFSDKDPKDTNPVPSRFGGYCNHGSVLFPTWHRPYVMLIEQAIGEKATEIAEELDKAESVGKRGIWKNAAEELRFPYWDWAEKTVQDTGFPPVLYEEKVEIRLPQNNFQEVDNPISFFPIKDIPADFTNETDDDNNTAYFTSWKKTLRHARSDPNETESRIGQLQKSLKGKPAQDLRSKIASLFAISGELGKAKTWDQFSNHTQQSKRQEDFYNASSLEGAHDSVHDIVGGNGHMAYPDYAGFDPFFFLHHCNVDRLFALWEYCFSEFWMEDGYTIKDNGPLIPWTQDQGTYNEVYNAQLLPGTALAPFRTDTGDYWSSEESRSLEGQAYKKYYSYPEVAGVKVDRPATKEQRVAYRKALQKYYGLDPKPDTFKSHLLFKAPSVPVPDDHSAVTGYRHFVVVVELLEHAYNGPYTFKLHHTLNGENNSELVGSVSVFARPDHSQCAACSRRRAHGSTIRGIIVVETDTVQKAIDNAGLNQSQTHLDLAVGIKSSFQAELVNPHGIVLGRAGFAGDDTSSPAGHIPKELAPVQVSLHSSAAAEDRTGGSIRWYDWQDHGNVFANGHHDWRKPTTD